LGFVRWGVRKEGIRDDRGKKGKYDHQCEPQRGAMLVRLQKRSTRGGDPRAGGRN